MCVLYNGSDGAEFFRPLIEVNVLFAEALPYRTLIPQPFSNSTALQRKPVAHGRKLAELLPASKEHVAGLDLKQAKPPARFAVSA